MIQTIKSKIITIVSTLKGDEKPLTDVYDFISSEVITFPIAMVEYMESPNEERLDTATNLITAKFLIKVFLNNHNDSGTSTLRITLIEVISNLFRTPANVDTLDGVVNLFDIEQIQVFNSYQDQPYSGFDLIIKTQFTKSIS